MTERNTSGADDVFWAMGCGTLVAVALTWATLGTLLDIVLVARTQRYCLGDLSVGEGLAGFMWAASRLVIFPVVSGVSVLVSLPIDLLARLPWFAERGWLKAAMVTLAILVSISGPMAMILYDVATVGTPGDCVPPWWPSWLPLQ
ncbi:hypothetical protein GCM10010517_11380 [Streptosporangium fragile]|uniref:Uncharacterized protein n=1 Tax=Streptosporangium fragile TaxID=46186 RepID=A0ABN3VSP3_9ACTN